MPDLQEGKCSLQPVKSRRSTTFSAHYFYRDSIYNDSNWPVLHYEKKRVSPLLVSISARPRSPPSACLIRCTIICLRFTRASGKYSFHHLPVFPAWNRGLATTLLAPALPAATKLGQTRRYFRHFPQLSLTLVLIFGW